MYSSKKSVLQLIGLLKEHEVRYIVLCPGSRNAAITKSIMADDFFKTYSIVDERSAGFFALGLSQQENVRVAVCCTSGTAALNLAPAVAEAYYQRLPLLVITADRPESYLGQMDGQMIPQRNVFGGLVHRSVQLPEINTDEESWYCNRLINEAILALKTNDVHGPAHINIPISEPMFDFSVKELPEVRVIKRMEIDRKINEFSSYSERMKEYDKVIIVFGQTQDSHDLYIKSLVKKHKAVILHEHLANFNYVQADTVANFDAILSCATEEEKKELAPDLLITLDGHIVSKRLKQFLRTSEIKEHWHVSPNGEVIDLSHQVTEIISCDESSFISSLLEDSEDDDLDNSFMSLLLDNVADEMKGSKEYGHLFNLEDEDEEETNDKEADNGYFNKWISLSKSIKEPKVPFSDVYAVGELVHKLKKVNLFLANSSSVRLAQLYKLNDPVFVFCNRGTSGIEGAVSSALGLSNYGLYPVYLITGDLGFFYDINGIWNKHLNKDLRIMLNNNGGGEIFKTVPGLKDSPELCKQVVMSHSTSAKAWVEQLGFTYLSASNEQEFQEALPKFMNENSNKPILFEVFTLMENNIDILNDYYENLKNI
jgi:2-succinyl-5-enolpyruvyl-6-hydroxy-3-cyclohexene-1-carboxylic-acid synthase